MLLFRMGKLHLQRTTCFLFDTSQLLPSMHVIWVRWHKIHCIWISRCCVELIIELLKQEIKLICRILQVKLSNTSSHIPTNTDKRRKRKTIVTESNLIKSYNFSRLHVIYRKKGWVEISIAWYLLQLYTIIKKLVKYSDCTKLNTQMQATFWCYNEWGDSFDKACGLNILEQLIPFLEWPHCRGSIKIYDKRRISKTLNCNFLDLQWWWTEC